MNETVECPSVRLSVPPFDRSSVGFAAERRAGRRCRSTAAGTQQQRRRRAGPQHGAQQQTQGVSC